MPYWPSGLKVWTMSSFDRTATFAIRLATADDVAAVASLSALDSAQAPSGDVLLGVVDGRPLAALSLATGHVVADPFSPTAELVDLLRARATALRGPGAGRRPRATAAGGRLRRRRASIA